ncbi:ABC transporter ATP-binding protein [Anaerotignum sp.]|uniref:ABC transporter ATP-binding protein n=1 Tax=Anaerotignum sp. TaxID=2039241 RepID=UPI00331CE142
MTFEVKGGSFGYNSKQILNNISFSIENGEVMSVLGSNGVGKTTLLKCMMGFLKWNQGETVVDGTNIQNIPAKELWKKIAYVPQAKGSAFAFSALDMVVLGRSAHIGTFKQPQKEDINIALRAMDDVGILYLKDKLCTQMSGGEFQMVLIARALTVSPNMLVLDEPESNLDFKNQLIILDTIKRLSNEKNISAIVNTHYPAHALQISDKSLMLNRDGSSFYGISNEIINEVNMKKAFQVNVHVNEFMLADRSYKSVIPLSLA